MWLEATRAITAPGRGPSRYTRSPVVTRWPSPRANHPEFTLHHPARTPALLPPRAKTYEWSCAEAGLARGDILVKIGDRNIANRFDVERALWSYKGGEKIEAVGSESEVKAPALDAVQAPLTAVKDRRLELTADTLLCSLDHDVQVVTL